VSAPAILSPHYRESCYWLEGVDIPSAPQGPLPGSAEVVIVGGGYTGIAAGRELAARGVQAVVLERATLGWGASTRNGGMVLPDVKHAGVAELRRRLGPGGAAVYASTVEAVRMVETLVEELRIDCDHVRSGHLELAHCPSHVRDLRHMQRIYRDELGIPARVLRPEELASEIGSGAYYGALAVESSGGLQPAKYFAGLARSAMDAGVEVHERTEALAIAGRNGRFVVDTSRGRLSARDVLVATDGYSGRSLPGLRRRIIPVGSFIIATEPIEQALAKEISPRGRMFFDSKNFLYYWRLSPDGTRVLFGGRASFAPTTIERARDYLYAGMTRVHPQLRGVAVDFAWGGNVGLTLDRIPRLGRLDGVTFAAGYSGTGVAASTYFGSAAGRWLAGEGPPDFANLPFRAIPLWSIRAAWLPLGGLWFKWQDRCGPGA
jgi:glycine/D-amino acid oxidase-like deaminating enzyme